MAVAVVPQHAHFFATKFAFEKITHHFFGAEAGIGEKMEIRPLLYSRVVRFLGHYRSSFRMRKKDERERERERERQTMRER